MHANPTGIQAKIADALALFHLLARALRFVVLFFAVPFAADALLAAPLCVDPVLAVVAEGLEDFVELDVLRR